MQSATDRDEYVIIHWNNIQAGKEINFDKRTTSEITDFGVPYDYDSVMHYSANAFARKKGLITIEPKDPNAKIGQRNGFSTRDLEKLAIMYDNSTSSEATTLYETTTSYETTTRGDSSPYATPSLFITLIIFTLNICTQFQ